MCFLSRKVGCHKLLESLFPEWIRLFPSNNFLEGIPPEHPPVHGRGSSHRMPDAATRSPGNFQNLSRS